MWNAANLLYDIIQVYYARRQGTEITQISSWVPELMNYPYNNSIIKLLENLLKYKCSQNDGNLYYTYIVTWNLFEKGEFLLLYYLLKHNVLNVEDLEHCPDLNFLLPCEKNDVYNPQFTIGQVINYRWHDLLGLQKFLYKMDGCTCISQRRLQLVLWGLDAITTRDVAGHLTIKKVLCIRTLFEFIREPFITSAEIMDIIRNLKLGDISSLQVQKWRDIYEDFFPESKHPFQPRSLQHLCRFIIRQNLRQAGRFPDDFEMLCLPKRLAVIPEAAIEDSTDYPAYLRNKDTTLEFRKLLEGDYMFNMMMLLLNAPPSSLSTIWT